MWTRSDFHRFHGITYIFQYLSRKLTTVWEALNWQTRSPNQLPPLQPCSHRVPMWLQRNKNTGVPGPEFQKLGHLGLIFRVFKKRFYLFLDRWEGWEKERERNISMWLPLMCPLPGTGPTTQACALSGNQTNIWFAGQCSIHWATPARALFFFKLLVIRSGMNYSTATYH